MSIPSNLDDYTLQWLTKLPKAAKLVLWLDPYALLELADHLVDNRGKSWQILSYRGDDFRFRAKLNQLDKTQPVIIWIRPPIGKAIQPLLDSSNLPLMCFANKLRLRSDIKNAVAVPMVTSASDEVVRVEISTLRSRLGSKV